MDSKTTKTTTNSKLHGQERDKRGPDLIIQHSDVNDRVVNRIPEKRHLYDEGPKAQTNRVVGQEWSTGYIVEMAARKSNSSSENSSSVEVGQATRTAYTPALDTGYSYMDESLVEEDMEVLEQSCSTEEAPREEDFMIVAQLQCLTQNRMVMPREEAPSLELVERIVVSQVEKNNMNSAVIEDCIDLCEEKIEDDVVFMEPEQICEQICAPQLVCSPLPSPILMRKHSDSESSHEEGDRMVHGDDDNDVAQSNGEIGLSLGMTGSFRSSIAISIRSSAESSAIEGGVVAEKLNPSVNDRGYIAPGKIDCREAAIRTDTYALSKEMAKLDEDSCRQSAIRVDTYSLNNEMTRLNDESHRVTHILADTYPLSNERTRLRILETENARKLEKTRNSAPWWGPSGGNNSADFTRLNNLTDPGTIKTELGNILADKLRVIRKACTDGSYFEYLATEALNFILGISHAWKHMSAENRKELKMVAGEILVQNDCFSLLHRCVVDIPELATTVTSGDDTDSKEMIPEHWEVYDCIWTIFVNFTDLSALFAVEFCRIPELLDLLKRTLLSNVSAHIARLMTQQDLTVLCRCSTICYNLALVDKNRATMRDMNFIVVLKPYFLSSYEDFRARSLLTMAYILDEKQSAKYLADRRQIEFLLSLLEESVNSPEGRCEGWSIEELLRGVARLAINDANKDALIKEGVLDILDDLLASSDIEELRGATKVMFLLAFDKKNSDEIIGDRTRVGSLINLRHHQDETVRQNAHGALWVLRNELRDAGYTRVFPVKKATADDQRQSNHVMISYQWDNQELLKKVKDQLKAQGYNVWMDIEQMHGSTLQAMADAVENAAVILVCLSQKYKDSPNCRAEAEYAFHLRKAIVPLKLEKGYRPDGWLGMVIGTRLYFDITREFDSSFENMVRELSGRGREFDPSMVPIKEQMIVPKKIDFVEGGIPHYRREKDNGTQGTSDSNSTIVPPKSQNSVQVTSQCREIVPTTYHISAPADLQKWFDSHHIYSENFRSLSGEEIAFLRQLLVQAPEYFYGYLEKRLHVVELRAIMKIVKALESLDLS